MPDRGPDAHFNPFANPFEEEAEGGDLFVLSSSPLSVTMAGDFDFTSQREPLARAANPFRQPWHYQRMAQLWQGSWTLGWAIRCLLQHWYRLGTRLGYLALVCVEMEESAVVVQAAMLGRNARDKAMRMQRARVERVCKEMGVSASRIKAGMRGCKAGYPPHCNALLTPTPTR